MAEQEHPCANGLTPECFEAYPEWAKLAFCYKLLNVLIPANISRRLPKGLFPGIIGPGASLPPGWIPPPGVIVPPNYTVPPSWIPFTYFILDPGLTWEEAFPPGWTAGDPLPDGVSLEPGSTLPPGWTPENPPPNWFAPGGAGLPIPPGGVLPPLYLPPGLQSPPHVPQPRSPISGEAAVWSEPWGYTLCENHLWTSVYYYLRNTANPDYRVYDCETGPEVSLVSGKLSYGHACIGGNLSSRDSHQINWNYAVESPYGIPNITKLKASFPVVNIDPGIPPFAGQVMYIELQVYIKKITGLSTTKTLVLWHNINPMLGPGEHELILDGGNPCTIRRIRIEAITRPLTAAGGDPAKGNIASWSCDYITFL